jgi:hypothetical protein
MPALSQHAFLWIPVVIVSSFVFSPPLAWLIAPMMMQRFIQARNMRFDVKSGSAVRHRDAAHHLRWAASAPMTWRSNIRAGDHSNE